MNLQLGQKVSHDGQAWYVLQVGETAVLISRGVIDPVRKVVTAADLGPIDDHDRRQAEADYHAYNFSSGGCL